MNYNKLLSEEIGNEIREFVIKDINENGYISVKKFLNIFKYGVFKLPGNKDIKETFAMVIYSFPKILIILFVSNTPNLEYIENEGIIKLKNIKIN